MKRIALQTRGTRPLRYTTERLVDGREETCPWAAHPVLLSDFRVSDFEFRVPRCLRRNRYSSVNASPVYSSSSTTIPVFRFRVEDSPRTGRRIHGGFTVYGFGATGYSAVKASTLASDCGFRSKPALVNQFLLSVSGVGGTRYSAVKASSFSVSCSGFRISGLRCRTSMDSGCEAIPGTP